jgi:hypothetical protein
MGDGEPSTTPYPRPIFIPSPTFDGTDLIGRVFNDPDLGLCRVVAWRPGEGNLDPNGPQLQAGWVPTLRMKLGQSREVGSRESQREGVNERREASARAGWKGGVWVERRFLRTRSRWPREMDRDWGGLRRRSLAVRPRILMYPRRMALKRVVLEGGPRAREI